jgi:hypothetical protein
MAGRVGVTVISGDGVTVEILCPWQDIIAPIAQPKRKIVKAFRAFLFIIVSILCERTNYDNP